MRIRFIKAEQTHALRQQVLRPAQPVGEMDWGGDRAETSFHLGAEEGEHIVAVASFMQEKHAELRGLENNTGLRGMATLPALSRHGCRQCLGAFSALGPPARQAGGTWCGAMPARRPSAFTQAWDSWSREPPSWWTASACTT
jgi:hypothetical protein